MSLLRAAPKPPVSTCRLVPDTARFCFRPSLIMAIPETSGSKTRELFVPPTRVETLALHQPSSSSAQLFITPEPCTGSAFSSRVIHRRSFYLGYPLVTGVP